MEAPSTVLEQFLIEMQASPAKTAELVYAGEELLSRAKMVAQQIHDRCHHAVASDRPLGADHNRLAGS